MNSNNYYLKIYIIYVRINGNEGGFAMTVLKTIKGYWNMNTSGNCDFNDNNMWEGQILLEDDGWFEGIVTDPGSPYKGDRMVFGIYHPDKIIELIKLSPANVSDPFVFRGMCDAKGYDGEFAVIEALGEYRQGTSRIITQDVDYVDVDEKNILEERNHLLEKLGFFKASNQFIELYKNTLAIRELMSQIALRNYENRGFTVEETEKIMEEAAPKVKVVVDSQNESIRKLAKSILKDTNDDEDFPF